VPSEFYVTSETTERNFDYSNATEQDSPYKPHIAVL
jgi:hypothetical protein